MEREGIKRAKAKRQKILRRERKTLQDEQKPNTSREKVLKLKIIVSGNC